MRHNQLFRSCGCHVSPSISSGLHGDKPSQQGTDWDQSLIEKYLRSIVVHVDGERTGKRNINVQTDANIIVTHNASTYLCSYCYILVLFNTVKTRCALLRKNSGCSLTNGKESICGNRLVKKHYMAHPTNKAVAVFSLYNECEQQREDRFWWILGENSSQFPNRLKKKIDCDRVGQPIGQSATISSASNF